MASMCLVLAIALLHAQSEGAGELSIGGVGADTVARDANAGVSPALIYRGNAGIPVPYRFTRVRRQPAFEPPLYSSTGELLSSGSMPASMVGAGADGPDGNQARSVVWIYRGDAGGGFPYRRPRYRSDNYFPGYDPAYNGFLEVPYTYRPSRYSDLIRGRIRFHY